MKNKWIYDPEMMIIKRDGVSPRSFVAECLDADEGRLIAAAPELLEACEEAEDLLATFEEEWGPYSPDGALANLRAAIAKARGTV
jgi:hypothetical protein